MTNKFTIDDFIQAMENTFDRLIKYVKLFDRSERAEIIAINTVGGFKEYTLKNAGATNTYKVFQINSSVPTLIVTDEVIVRHIKNGDTNFFIDAKIEKRI